MERKPQIVEIKPNGNLIVEYPILLMADRETYQEFEPVFKPAVAGCRDPRKVSNYGTL